MKTTSRPALDEPAGRPARGADSARIGAEVLRALGKPPDLCAVQVHHLWENQYRVNVFAGETIVSAKIVSSFFVDADAEGRILATNPEIIRKYQFAAETKNKQYPEPGRQ
jgi:hypothetical protein